MKLFSHFIAVALILISFNLFASGSRSITLDNSFVEKSHTVTVEQLAAVKKEMHYLGSNDAWHFFAYVDSNVDRSNPPSMPWSYPVSLKLSSALAIISAPSRILLDGRSLEVYSGKRIKNISGNKILLLP